MAVTPLMVKELREKTAAGMLDCKKALEATEGNIENAIVWLREKGIAKAEKKASLVAAEGLCNAVACGNKLVSFELNSQTDFVAKNQKFIDLLTSVGEIILSSDATNDVEALAVDVEGKTLNEVILQASSTIGEKISLRRVSVMTKNDDEVFGVYKHQGGRIVAVVVVKGENSEVARDIAMHVAAINPKYISKAEISPEVLEKEREIILHEALNENEKAAKKKPVEIIEKMVVGRLNKYLQENCLVDQTFVKNPDFTVAGYVANNKTEIVSVLRLEVGEGIEKQVVDFAAEVAAQVKSV